MARSDTLRVLIVAECHDLPSVEATLRAITERLDVFAAGPDYVAAHRRIDELLRQREQLLAARARNS